MNQLPFVWEPSVDDALIGGLAPAWAAASIMDIDNVTSVTKAGDDPWSETRHRLELTSIVHAVKARRDLASRVTIWPCWFRYIGRVLQLRQKVDRRRRRNRCQTDPDADLSSGGHLGKLKSL
jgi:hypothetical protein